MAYVISDLEQMVENANRALEAIGDATRRRDIDGAQAATEDLRACLLEIKQELPTVKREFAALPLGEQSDRLALFESVVEEATELLKMGRGE